MRTQRITGAPSSLVPRLTRTLLLLTLCAAGAPAATPAGHGDRDASITVRAVGGDVDVTMAGVPVEVRPDSNVALPARVVTGHDGTLALTQAGTNITVSNDTDIEIPAEAVDGNLIARLVQHRGNVFYDVAPRDVGKLRVETPLLVAVIKGTQFNVAVQQDGTTISLFEGSLEIHTPDDGEVIQIEAGEIAIRSFRDDAIRVVGMNDARVAPPRPAAQAVAGAVDASARADAVNDTAAAGVATSSVSVDSKGPGSPERDVVEISSGELRAKPNTETTARVDVAAGKIEAVNGGGVGLAAGHVDVALDTGVETRADVALDTGLEIRANNGHGTSDTGLEMRANRGHGALDTGLDLATGALDLGLGGTPPDVSVDTTLDLGGTLDTGIDTAVDLGRVDTGLDLGGALDLGLDTGVDLGSALDLALDLGGTLDSIDLGDGGAAPPATGDTAPPPPPSLFDGLGGALGRP